MNESTPQQLPRRKPVFGVMAMVSLCTSGCFWWYFLLHKEEWANSLAGDITIAVMGGGHDTKNGAWPVSLAGLLLFLALGVVFAITGLVRRERPRWPALVALILGLLTLAACFFPPGQGPAH